MERVLRAFSFLMLVFSGIVFALIFIHILQDRRTMVSQKWLSIIDTPVKKADVNKISETTFHPLVRQAEAFASYLSSTPRLEAQSFKVVLGRQKQDIQALGISKTTPKFKLLATSYYRSRPMESMALVSEPSSGVHWIKHGARLGHFVVESIKAGSILYRDGDTLVEMSIDTKSPVGTGKTFQRTVASVRSRTSTSRPLSPVKSSIRGGRLLYKLGLPRPGAQSIVYDRRAGSGGQ